MTDVMGDDERIDRFADEVIGRLVCLPDEADRRRQELLAHLRDAADAGALDEALAGLGSPGDAAAAFAPERSAPDAIFAQRSVAALIDNVPLLVVAVALAVQGLQRGGATLLAFPPPVYFQRGGVCVSLVPGSDCDYDGAGLLYAIGVPAALMWSIVVLGFMETRWGASPGKLLLGLRVVTVAGLRIRMVAGVMRRVSLLLGPMAWLDWIPFLAGQRRRLLDRLAGTRVIVLCRNERRST